MSDLPGHGGLISSASAPQESRVTAAWAESTETDEPASLATDDPGMAAAGVTLNEVECRTLGSMIEKSFLTPDVYPMTTNALVSACNQKTNRDPVVSYDAVQLDSVLLELRQRNLVRRVHAQGARSTKHRQTLDEALSLNERELALMSVLLLRGPQTVGELRLRTERHDVGFDDLDAVDLCLGQLATRTVPLVVELPRQPGHKENRWQHLLLDGEVDSVSSDELADSSAPVPVSVAHEPGLTGRVVELETQVVELQRQLASLADKLGEPLE